MKRNRCAYLEVVKRGTLSLTHVLWSMQVVPVDSLLRSFGVYQLEAPWFRLIFLGPPLLAATLFAIVLWRRSSSGRAR